MSQATASRSTSVAGTFATQLAIVIAIVIVVAAAALVVGATNTSRASVDRADMPQVAQDAWGARYEGIAVQAGAVLTRGRAAEAARWRALADSYGSAQRAWAERWQAVADSHRR